MVKNCCSAMIYSQEYNQILALKIKNMLSSKGVVVLCIDNIDNVLLNRYYRIEYLILDFTKNILDKKSLSLLETLYNDGVIENVILIFSKENSFPSKFCSVILDDKFENSFRTLFNELMEKRNSQLEVSFCSWRKIISKYLYERKFSLRHSGFLMLVDSIIYYIDRNCAVRNLAKELYVFLAQKYHVSKSCAEISIRKSISLAYSRKMENCPFARCPTNKEFINFALSQLYDEVITTKVIK